MAPTTTAHPTRARRTTARRTLTMLAATGLAGALAACSLSGSSSGPATSSPGAGSGTTGGKACPNGEKVVVATHDSFALPDEVLATFGTASGCQVQVLKNGDAGALTNKLVLTKSSPIADVVFGVDNTFATRAVKEGVFADYTPARLPGGATDHAAVGAGATMLTPVDYGDVCVNIDTTWFAAKGVPEPKTLDDLTKPAYKDLFVTPSAATSSPGFAFFLATVGSKGADGWRAYWQALKANGVKIAAGWTDAYTVDFTAGGGTGSKPIVTSYASSPPFTIPKGKTEPTTKALLDTCFRQTEYAGVIGGAKNPAGAKAFIDFLVSAPVQAAIPEAMYMYPVAADAPLPADWKKWAAVAPKPIEVPADVIDANRDAWLRDWTELTSR